mmetsp:Transcript_21967/g.52062  ORF Transcript_21967/g.52062 Transcript_21967/m.52062 type:complete len:283 (-) Transcript_21967:2592-3440(-)
MWAAEQHLLGHELERHELEIFNAMPRDHVTLVIRRPEDGRLQLHIALGLEVGERRAASHWVEDEAQGLQKRQCAVHLAEAVLREEVAFGDEDRDDRRGLDVLFERVDGLQIVHVQEDRSARQHDLELALDCGALVLPRPPDMRKKHVPPVSLCEWQIGRCLGRLQSDRGHARGLDDLLRRHRRRHRHRHQDGAHHAHSDKGDVEGVFVAELIREHGVHRFGELAEFEHEHKEERRCESKAARLAKVVVAFVLEGRGDGDEQHVNQRDEEGYHELLDGAHHDK